MSRPSVSYYRATVPDTPPAPVLDGPRQASVCIVGGGFAGLNTALGLAERGFHDVVVLEADTVGHGASGRNGGFVFGGFSRGEEALLRELGPERARALYRGTTDAVELIRRRIDTYAIACDVSDSGVIWANWFRDSRINRVSHISNRTSSFVDGRWRSVSHAITSKRSSMLTTTSSFITARRV